ncbi:MAG TPA: tetratricopeptide repeat protein [Gemmatimonadales bacterium]|nr:tetratricopeptide repeat protein [Gemmatimonadales bacterium]
MTVGLPGTGIGGLFYLLSAAAMPLGEAYRRLRGRAARGGWRVVLGQTAIATGILAGMWATGWLLGAGLRAAHPFVPHIARAPSGNVLRTTMLVLSFGTLAVVLVAVELLRLWVHGRSEPDAELEPRALTAADAAEPREPRLAAGGGGREPSGRLSVARSLVLVVALGAIPVRTGVAQHSSPLAVRLARADSEYAAGDAGAAARAYAAVLAADPENSRATYRLAQLRRSNPAEALRLFRRYVALEPTDPWGYMALGDLLARVGRYAEALLSYDTALRLAPTERDAVVGRARVLARARRTDAAIAAYTRWLAAHPADADAWRECAKEELRAGRPDKAVQALAHAQALAPDRATAERLAAARAVAAAALTPVTGGSHDSDGNTTLRLAGVAELAADGPVRWGISGGREAVRNAVTGTGVEDLSLRAGWRPRAALQVDAAAGGTRLDAPPGVPAAITPTGQLRVRWRAPAAGPAIDLRAQRSPLDATPLLVANRVVRSEVGAIVDLPLANALRLRAIGRTAALSDSAERNHRTTLGGVVAVAATSAVELSAQFHEIGYAHPSTAGYFAPRQAQVVEAGSYVEVETPQSVLLAFDLGAGVQRVALQGGAFGAWTRALRLYALVVAPLAPGRDLHFELDAEDSPIAETATTGQWQYVAATLSLRWALP